MFWTGRRQIRALEARVEALESSVLAIGGKVDAHQETVDELDRIRIEWADYFEKFRSLYGRLSKRAQRDGEPESARQPEPINPAALRLLGRL